MPTPLKAIRAKCLECCNGSSHEASLCPCPNCALHPFRFGKNPHIKLSDEEKARRAALLQKSTSQQGSQNNISPSEGRDTPKTQTLSEPYPSA